MTNDKRRRLSAILFADIEGYSALMQADESKAMNTLKSYQTNIKTLVAKHEGQLIKNYGDGSLCLFPSILSAVLCAKDLQLKIAQTIPLRIGIHVGDIMHAENDVYGDALNIASRIESIGVPGSILLSDSVYHKVKNHTHLKMKSLGEFNFKNIEQKIEVYALANTGLIVPKKSELYRKFKENKKSVYKSYNSLRLVALLFVIALALYGGSYLMNNKFGLDKTISNRNHVEENSIAVLAFSDMSAEQNQKYFSEGISEEILNLLTKIPDLKVISRSSSFTFKDKNVTSSEIGEALNVNHILDGSIRKSGNTLRISAQLIESQSGEQLWSETYDRPMDDIFKIQDEIAHKIINKLEINLMGKSINAKPVNINAYNLFLEANQLMQERNYKSDSLADQKIRASLNIDNTYAPSWALLSEVVYNGAISFSRYTIPEAMPISIDAAKKAIELDPESSLGYIAMTTLNRAENNFVAADRHLSKALEIDPMNVDVIYEASSYALDLGNMNEAIAQIQKAIRLDPVNELLYYTHGLYLIWTEDLEGAKLNMAKYLKTNPTSALANNFMAEIYFKQGMINEANHVLEKDTDPYWSIYRKSIIEYGAGNKNTANQYLNDFIEEFGDEGWPNIAHIYACRGEKDNAFKWLDLAHENNDASLFEILNYPEFKILKTDPRWNIFIKKLNLPSHEGFSVKN